MSMLESDPVHNNDLHDLNYFSIIKFTLISVYEVWKLYHKIFSVVVNATP